MERILVPCYELCYLRSGKVYTEECEEMCAYAKTVEKLKHIQEIPLDKFCEEFLDIKLKWYQRLALKLIKR